MKEYYSKRASEYEAIYRRDDPVRQREQNKIREELKFFFKDKSVLEIACGTGYWTETISQAAKSIVAVDYSPEVIEIAKSKNLDAEFIIDDAYKLEKVDGIFNAGCANFWISHVPKNKIRNFISTFHQKLIVGAHVFLADNVYVEGVGGKLIRKENESDTYKIRKLSDGTTYEVLKNYFDTGELKKYFDDVADDLEITFGKCFWWMQYRTK